MRPIAVLPVLTVLALACNPIRQVAKEVVEQAATQVPAVMTAAVEPTPSPPSTSAPQPTRPKSPEPPVAEGNVCSKLGLPTDIPIPVTDFGGWVGGQLPAGLASQLEAWARPFLQPAAGQATPCGWAAYSSPQLEVAIIAYEAEVNPTAVGHALKSAFSARGYDVLMRTVPTYAFLALSQVPELNGGQVFVYIVSTGLILIAQRQPAP